MIIRSETDLDIEAISEVTASSFEKLELSSHTEQFIIKALREADALTVSLVAELEGQVAGHIAFSPVEISDGSRNWFGLGPVSVHPNLQGRGIGSALIKQGLSILKDLGGQGCVLVGHPGYYTRFGFRNIPGLVFEGVPPEVFFTLPFGDEVPQGEVVFHKAFRAEA